MITAFERTRESLLCLYVGRVLSFSTLVSPKCPDATIDHVSVANFVNPGYTNAENPLSANRMIDCPREIAFPASSGGQGGHAVQSNMQSLRVAQDQKNALILAIDTFSPLILVGKGK